MMTLVSCSLAQMLWSLPGCSAWEPPQLQLCFNIMVSYTRPVPPWKEEGKGGGGEGEREREEREGGRERERAMREREMDRE